MTSLGREFWLDAVRMQGPPGMFDDLDDELGVLREHLFEWMGESYCRVKQVVSRSPH